MNLRVDQEVVSTPSARLRREFATVRGYSKRLTEPLSAEDHGLQSMADASPTKWHLAHTTWFFETLVLKPHAPNYVAFDPRYHELFNSYYEALGPRHPRPQRGVLSRPSLREVWAYREYVEAALDDLLAQDTHVFEAMRELITLGLHHEQQHQELILSDIKHAFALNPLHPTYLPAISATTKPTAMEWRDHAGGLVEIGHLGSAFAFDNETPRHRVWLEPYQLGSRPITCGEFQEFINDGGYTRPEWWLSDGWSCVQAHGWNLPLYWYQTGGGDYSLFTLHGMRKWNADEPVCHLSYYEAAAYAAWAGARLPTEFEWEAGAPDLCANYFPDRALHPRTDSSVAGYGEVWEWTQSAYAPYPGFKPLAGVASEYNGKFMVNQLVLRGGSCVTPPGHLRATYRNFFTPTARWQFSGIRLARDIT
ncbi:MAG: ergothioneine biosynthesis protein EgtB [Gammaproteobacteria bacterium]|nr:ergothioneine biosynthesis protein EgtB [Gammaproteobacteria bacterium]